MPPGAPSGRPVGSGRSGSANQRSGSAGVATQIARLDCELTPTGFRALRRNLLRWGSGLKTLWLLNCRIALRCLGKKSSPRSSSCGGGPSLCPSICPRRRTVHGNHLRECREHFLFSLPRRGPLFTPRAAPISKRTVITRARQSVTLHPPEAFDNLGARDDQARVSRQL